MSFLPPLRARLRSLVASRRVRGAILLLGGYQTYQFYRTYNTLNKPFTASRHRPGQTILDLDLDAVELARQDSLPVLRSSDDLSVSQLVSTLHAAAEDPRVAGLVVRGVGGLGGLGLAEIAELRNAIIKFRNGWGGKVAVLHVPEGLGAGGNGTVPLYFASGFEGVFIQPTSPVIVPGLSMGMWFFKKGLEKAGIKVKKVARKEFKTAVNGFTEEGFTEPHRESVERLLEEVMDEIIGGVAEGRHISKEKVREALEMGVMTVEAATESGLIDGGMYRDQLPVEMRKRIANAEDRRSDIRERVVNEWRDAMDALKRTWKEGEMLKVWANGDILHHLRKFQTSVAVGLAFADFGEQWKKEAVEAELRALKAHLAWLDTCPWEVPRTKEEEENGAYKKVGNISSLLETERKLVADAINSLESCPKLLDDLREEGSDEIVLMFEEKSSMDIIRRARGIWRAKCLAARIVGTLMDADADLQQAMTKNPEDFQDNVIGFQPRIFLTGYNDEPHWIASIPHDDAEDKSDGLPKVSADQEESPDENQGLIIEKPKRQLRHTRFADYVDLLFAEKKAAVDRSTRFIRVESKDPHQRLPWAIDHAEKHALLRLQIPGHRFTPWRFALPRGGIIAVIDIEGTISDETADATRAAIRRADKDPFIQGIVLRIDSPGGSATASDLISRAVEVASKPVVASMGSVCASGGYFISAPCDKVFASNATITGSIGIIYSSPNFAGLFEKLGITSDNVDSTRFSKYFGANGGITEWSEDFAGRIDALIDRGYEDFVNAVARGRGMQFEQAEKIARGRVWAGSDALNLGLVDEIGGLHDAVKACAELAWLPPDGKINAINYPTTAMQVQDAARRRGLMPSNLDEEGDESISERKRRWWFQRMPEDEENNSDDAASDVELDSVSVSSMGWWDYKGISHFVLAKVLGSLDRMLMESNSHTMNRVIENCLGRVMKFLAKDPISNVIVEELERTKAIAGRPAAIAPHMRMDD